MKFFDIVQGSAEWGIIRMGKPSASDFDIIMTPSGDVSKAKTVDRYENRLIAEIMLMRPVRTITPTYAMERGTELEPEARKSYEFITGNRVEHGGFIMDDNCHYGCSPDGRILNLNRGLELKCPFSEEKHITYLIDNQALVDEYKAQVQGQIFTAEFESVDLMSYYPELPPVIVNVKPLTIWQVNLPIALNSVRERMNAKIEKLISEGHFEIEGYNQMVDEVKKSKGEWDGTDSIIAAG